MKYPKARRENTIGLVIRIIVWCALWWFLYYSIPELTIKQVVVAMIVYKGIDAAYRAWSARKEELDRWEQGEL
jgi:hypothetical protein